MSREELKVFLLSVVEIQTEGTSADGAKSANAIICTPKIEIDPSPDSLFKAGQTALYWAP